MFSKTLFVVAAFVAGALASDGGEGGQCATSDQYCCNSVQNSNSPQIANIVGALGIPVNANLGIGLTCTPISVLAIAGNKCDQKPTCCNKYHSDSLVGVGCTPLSVLG